jgi:hypothetical protein
MAYLSAKKIYPGDMTEPLNGWYQNIDTTGGSDNNASKAGPTSVLANPGWQFYQLRGYVPVTTATGDGFTTVSQVVIPSPYKNDDTRTNITGMTVVADTERPSYVYRTAISVASGWGDGRVAEDGLTTSGATQVIGFGPGTASAPVSFSGVVEGANITATANNIAPGEGGLGTNPFQTATTLTTPMLYKEYTADQEFRVYSKTATNSTATNGGWAISDADKAAGRTGYILVEVCFIRPDVAVEYDDMEQYLPYKIASNYPGY